MGCILPLYTRYITFTNPCKRKNMRQTRGNGGHPTTAETFSLDTFGMGRGVTRMVREGNSFLLFKG
ncbi:hypothetical protein SESBI_04809 [Sesbania bispinosa]|nr:hypothetical protein SESBI_04809 [Sesbania bispinosa]